MRNGMVIALLICFSSIFNFACDNNSDLEIIQLTVASKKIKVNDPASQIEIESICVKYPNSETWEPFYSFIRGFDYEEGYEYILKIAIEEISNPPQDGLSVRYSLIEILSKKKKDSEF